MNSDGFDKGAYYVALEGVTRYGLAEAAKAILRGALCHAFYPSPPELRMQCDKAMEWHERRAERERYAKSQAMPDSKRQEPTPEAKARMAKVYANFCKSYERKPVTEPLKLDPALVAQLPDNPSALVRRRMGVEKGSA